MGGAGLGAKKTFGARAKEAQPHHGLDAPQHDALRRPLQSFASKAQSLFASLDAADGGARTGGHAPGADAAKPWVVGIDAEAAEAAAEVAAHDAASLAASATSTVAANTLANALLSMDQEGVPDERPPLYTAVLDDNAYDRKMRLRCDGAGKGGGKRLGWSPAQVQIINDASDEDDDGEAAAAVVVDAEGNCLDASAISSLGAAPVPAQQCPVAHPSTSPRGILKAPPAARKAGSHTQAPATPTASLPDSSAHAEEPRVPARGGGAPGAGNGGRGGGAGKPCFEFAQTGKCRRGTACRFAHALPECMVNPEKYTRYEISWDEEEDRGANKAAALATLALLRDKGMSEEEVKQDQEASRKAAAEREERQRLKREKLKSERAGEEDAGDQEMVSGTSGGGKGGGGKPKKKAKSGPLLSFADDE